MVTRNRLRESEVDVLEFVARGVKSGLGAAEIRQQMKLIPRFEYRLPNTRRLQRLVKDLKKRFALNTIRSGILDQPFEWHRLDEYEIPWEASAYLLDVWRYHHEHSRDDDNWKPSTPSARFILWSWRIHLADPDLAIEFVPWLASAFEDREVLNNLMAQPGFGFEDLEALLAYKPWTSEDGVHDYVRAVRDQRIPFLFGQSIETVAGYDYFWEMYKNPFGFFVSFVLGYPAPDVLYQRFQENVESSGEVEQ